MYNNSSSQCSFISKSEKFSGPVECLGMKFPNDDERRKFFIGKLKDKLKDPEFRKIEGFPVGSDADILALSDPPYYTACPNPFIEDFIRVYSKPYDEKSDHYSREPFATDISEGKNDPIYNAHSYHTKVPYKAIMRYILHYTEPGDLVLDGFCGTGMTGVAARTCANPENDFKNSIAQENAEVQWGARKSIQGDISPAATFIAYNLNVPVNIEEFGREARHIMADVDRECGWMYETIHTDGRKGRINYTVWSDVFICSSCSKEIIFWDPVEDDNTGTIEKEISCPHCGARCTKRNIQRAFVTKFDKAINQSKKQARQVPVLINYTIGNKRFEKKPEKNDMELIKKIEDSDIPYWFPIDRMIEGDESRRNDDVGLTHVYDFYTKRNLWVLAAILGRIGQYSGRMKLFMNTVELSNSSNCSSSLPDRESSLWWRTTMPAELPPTPQRAPNLVMVSSDS